MAGPEPTPWVRLTFEGRGQRLFLGYEDHHGRRTGGRPADPPTGVRLLGWQSLNANDVPDALASVNAQSVAWSLRVRRLLTDTVGGEAVHRGGPHGGEAIPVAVLVRAPSEQPWSPAYEELVRTVLDRIEITSDSYVLAAEIPEPNEADRPFTLPFDVSVTTSDPGALESFVRSVLPDLRDDELAHAMRVEAIPLDALGRATSATDILVTSVDALIRGNLSRMDIRPRLVIAEDPFQQAVRILPGQIPAGTSVVTLPAGMPASSGPVTQSVLRALMHDWPLHEAVHAAGRESGITGVQRAELKFWTSAAGLDSLRLTTAFEQFTNRSRAIVRYRSVGRNFEQVAPRLPIDSSQVNEAVDLARWATDDFMRESAGLSEMARAAAAQDRAEPNIEAIDHAGAALLADEGIANRLAASQNRRVAIWLTHDPGRPQYDRHPEIGRHTVLVGGRTYLLNVGVGIDWPTDLVDPDTPPVDPILPPTGDMLHRLTVAVFSDTATVLDEPAKELRLGTLGPSDPVTFRVETPTRGSSTRIRVIVYHRGHVVQAFALVARLGDREENLPAHDALTVELSYSRREQLRDIDTLPARVLSVATNDSAGGTHSLMFDTGYAVQLSEKTTDKSRRYFRERMAATLEILAGKATMGRTDFDSEVKLLAESGRALWGRLFDPGSDPFQQRLVDVSQTAGRTIQILRLETEFAFPWVMIYDWKLPPTKAEMQAAPVCLGVVGGEVCACDALTAGVCVRGFWGIRHVIEELVQHPRDEYVATISSPPGSPAVLCTVGEGGDQWSQDMVAEFLQELGPARFEDFDAEKALLQRLWDEANRPAVLVVVGHLTNTPKATEPDRPRIYVRSSERYLDTESLRQAKIDHGVRQWEAPYRPIVLLLGCDSGHSGLGDIHNFVASLTSAGASAVIATEEKIDTRLAGDVARAVVRGLGTAGPGERLRAWRANTIARGNPLGLVFTCFGSADVVVPALVSGPARQEKQEESWSRASVPSASGS